MNEPTTKSASRLVDLHCHSTASDGSTTPAEVVARAAKKGLAAIAITDHDTIAGVAEAMNAGEDHGIEVVPAVELSSRYDGHTVHLTALFIDPENDILLEHMEQQRRWRIERNEKLIASLNAHGLEDISVDDLKAFGDSTVLTRAHLGEVLARKGYASNAKVAIDRYIRPGLPGYVSKKTYTPKQWASAVHTAGGLIFVAHMNQIVRGDHDRCVEIAKTLIRDDGIDGLEARYCEFDDGWRKSADSIAEELGCLRSGGSDFHGYFKPGLELGCGYDNTLEVPYEFVEAMKAALPR